METIEESGENVMSMGIGGVKLLGNERTNVGGKTERIGNHDRGDTVEPTQTRKTEAELDGI